jgi:hypothetical protein
MKLAVSQDYLALAELMLKAQRKYVVSKTKDDGFRKGFVEKIDRYIKEVEPNNIATYLIFREWAPRVIEVNKKKPGFIDRMLYSAQIEGEAFAEEIILDVIESIDLRFLEGGSKLYEALLDAKDYRRAKGK